MSTSDNKKAEYKDDEISADVKYPVKHALSRELQVSSCIHVDCIDIMSPIPLLLLYDAFLGFLCCVQLYFEKITELTVGRSDSILFKEALLSLATDSGLHPLVPYFTYFISDEVNIKLVMVDVICTFLNV